jgi:hypothetical protein
LNLARFTPTLQQRVNRPLRHIVRTPLSPEILPRAIRSLAPHFMTAPFMAAVQAQAARPTFSFQKKTYPARGLYRLPNSSQSINLSFETGRSAPDW